MIRLLEELLNVVEMAFDPGKFPDFVHPSQKDWIETGDEELDKLFPSLTEGEQSYLEMITSKTYQDMAHRLEIYTGIQAEKLSLPRILSLVYQSLQKVKDIESGNKDTLEDLAQDIVLGLPEFKMVEEAFSNGEVEFDIRLAPPELEGSIDNDAPEEDLSPAEKVDLDLTNELEGFDEQKLRRRVANLLIQGSSVLKTYLFNEVSTELNKIDKSLMGMYGILSVVAQLGYWITPVGFAERAVKSQGAQKGSEQVIPKEDIYIIKVRAVAFPYLVHELVKGIYDWISIDPELKKAMEQDSIGKETRDLIVGPELVKTLTSYVPVDKQELIPLIHKLFLQLPTSQMKAVFAKGSEGKQIMDDLIKKAQESWEEYYGKENSEEEEEEF